MGHTEAKGALWGSLQLQLARAIWEYLHHAAHSTRQARGTHIFHTEDTMGRGLGWPSRRPKTVTVGLGITAGYFLALR